MTFPYQPSTSREILDDLGIGDYNQTLVIQTMMMSPATTEASSAPVMLLVGHLQDALNQMGMSLVRTQRIDAPTAEALAAVAGPDFLGRTWLEVVKAVVAARDQGARITRTPRGKKVGKKGLTVTIPGLGLFDLPDVPGGLATYAAGGILLWYLLKKKKRAS